MSKLGQRLVSDDKREDADCGNNRSAANYGRAVEIYGTRCVA
jgi:hypothetical protein